MTAKIWDLPLVDDEDEIASLVGQQQGANALNAGRFRAIVERATSRTQIITGRPRVAVICPTSDEFAALRGALSGCSFVPPASERYPGGRPVAMNYYLSDVPTVTDSGEVTGKNEELVCAYFARQGLTSAAFSVTALLHAFPTVNHVILCGVAAGVPTPAPSREEWKKSNPHLRKITDAWRDLLSKHGETDVRLGDIVIGEAAIQFDFGKQTMFGFVPKGEPVRCCQQLKAVSDRLYERMRSEDLRPWDNYIDSSLSFLSKNRKRPVIRPTKDILQRFRLERNEQSGELQIIAKSEEIVRGVPVHKIPKDRPNLFRAKVGSSDLVMKDSRERDKIGLMHKVGILEMEGFAAMQAASCFQGCNAIIIRGVCDYADADKNDEWWMYSAACAASYARCLVETLHLHLDNF